MDLPEKVAAAAVSLCINSAGDVRAGYTPLMTVEEMDPAVDKAAALLSQAPAR